MSRRLENTPLKDLLPDVCRWLESLDMAKVVATEPVAGDHLALAARAESENGGFQLCGQGLPNDLRSRVEQALIDLGWNAGIGTVHVLVDDFKVTVVPLTKVKSTNIQVNRQFGLDLAGALKEMKVGTLAVVIPDKDMAGQVLEGLAGGFYELDGYKKKKEKQEGKYPRNIRMIGCGATVAEIERARDLAVSASLVRLLQDSPANVMTPPKLSEVGMQIGRETGAKCTILGRAEMETLKMESFLSVSDGGGAEPQLIVIDIPGDDNGRCLALVGKGVTFDSGGISLKPSASMEEMKYDMSGAAAVLGAASFLGRHKPPVRVVCLVGATENLPSGNATRPGDIVTAMNGKTIEVFNTDAEGRLVLADVLAYAVEKFKPDLILDAATLTGSVLHGLGHVGAGLMSNSDAAADEVLTAGAAVGEPLWRLPLWPELKKEVKGDTGDLKNIAKSGVMAGSIVGGVFLHEFVGETNWVHLDIAGTAWNCQATGYPTSGGSAFGLRTMVETARRFGVTG